MKKFHISYLIIFLSTFLLKAQDTIVLKRSDIIVGEVTKITNDEIEYKSNKNPNGPSYTLSRDNVVGIIYSNGLTDIFDLNSFNSYKKSNSKANSEPVADIQKKQEINEDSVLIEKLKTEQIDNKKINEQILQKNKEVIDNQRKQDSLIQVYKKQQELSDKEIQENLKNQFQKTANKIQLVLDSLTNLKTKLFPANLKIKEEKWEPKFVGIGIDVAGVLRGISDDDSYSNLYAPCVFVLSLTPLYFLRIDIEYAALYEKGSSTNYYFAGGILSMWQKGKGNFYAGAKVMRFSSTSMTIFSPTIGAEYVFGNRFSIGSEVGFPFNLNGGDAAMIMAFNRFIFRFYF